MHLKLIPYLQALIDNEQPFLALRKAHDNHVIVLSQIDNELYNKPSNNMPCGVFSKFHNNDNHVYIYGEERVSFPIEKYDKVNVVHREEISGVGKKEYVKLFDTAISRLQNEALSKVVLSRKQKFQTSKSHVDIFQDLLFTYPTANGYFFHHPKVGRWVGATPELLLKVADNYVSTMSLAGTALFDENMKHIWGEKEIEEQQYVTQFIKEQFQKANIENIDVSALETIQAGHLIHLRQLITGSVNNNKTKELLELLHPTPAVCGLPRDKAKEFILNFEGYDRSYYTGYIGIIEERSQEYFVNLRCMELSTNMVTIYVGGGITVKSNVDAEFKETIEKLQTMYRLL